MSRDVTTLIQGTIYYPINASHGDRTSVQNLIYIIDIGIEI